MATRKKDEKHDKGIIRDENDQIRYDAGEATKDEYEYAGAYEKDHIELKGIAYFTIGLFIMVVVTFGLMWLLQSAMEEQAKATYEKEKSPMAMSERENLPPEPRLQAAPGFEVREESGKTVNLELREPQAEYRELTKEWEKVWREGRKDPNTGTVITLPIEEAKKRVLQDNAIKTRPADQAAEALKHAQQIPMYSSAGRTTEIRRQ